MHPRELLKRISQVLSGAANRSPRVPQQVTRLVLVFAVMVAALLVARARLVPPTFGELGHYRGSAVTEARAIPMKYAGRAACSTCHWDVLEAQSKGFHQMVACEACHGPAFAHTENQADFKPHVPRAREFCLRCHEYDPSRPTGFPQIDPIAHNPLKACVGCHDPHSPAPPNPPSTCTACHAEIARVKAVSHHTSLTCERCHETAAEHMDTPRLSRPEKPRAREFCSACHAAGASSPIEIPRIDPETHGSPYVCWQCHYPHYPEVG